MKKDPGMQLLSIGYDEPQDWQSLNIPGQRLLRCGVRFEEQGTPVDYRLLLAEVWRPVLSQLGLCAGIIHTALGADQRPSPLVGAWVWRQCGVPPHVRLDSLSVEELSAVLDLLHHASPQVIQGFSAFELQSTARAGNHRKVRKFVCRGSAIVVSECDEEISQKP